MSRQAVLEASGGLVDTDLWVFAAASPTTSLETARKLLREADLKERHSLASRFAERARAQDGVIDVLLGSLVPDLNVVVLLDDDNLDRELALHAIFIDLARELPDPGLGDLTVLSSRSEVPADSKSLL